jgi:hypothetical protein
MDASLLQLFTAEEILKRLTKQAHTGALHIFTVKEAANIFFQEGIIIGAAKGLVEGEEVVKQIMEWKDARLIWQEGQTPTPGLKPLDLHFPEFLVRLKVAPKLEAAAKPLSEGKPDTRSVFISIPSRAASTGPMGKPEELRQTGNLARRYDDAPPLPPVEVAKADLASVATTSLSATKSIHPVPLGADPFEEALMRKHKLALVSVEDPGLRLRIIRSSNLLGRNPACDFTMNHGSVSRQHCLLQITERGLHAKDLSTTNGTKVNGIKLTEGYINIGDKLTIGDLDFILEKDEPVVV